tara:strand:+ start:366 stop:995 length:630 start_codon:yes stop_codon:yes gene_type:complete
MAFLVNSKLKRKNAAYELFFNKFTFNKTYIMKKTIILMVPLVFLFTCGSVQIPGGEDSYDTPCKGKDYRTTKKYFRVSADASSNATAGAEIAARRKAEAKMISSIKSTLALVSDLYEGNIEDGSVGEYEVQTKEYSRKIAVGTLKNIKVICEKTTKVRNTGQFKHYIALEMSASDVIDDLTSVINSNRKNMIKSNSEEMRAIFEKALSN